MLAQNFKTAEELGIHEDERAALVTVLGMLERGEIKHVRDDGDKSFYAERGRKFTGHFNMKSWNFVDECNTVCCIAGTAELLLGRRFDIASRKEPRFWDLCYPTCREATNYNDITPDQAATALRSYLTTGDAKWSKAIGR